MAEQEKYVFVFISIIIFVHTKGTLLLINKRGYSHAHSLLGLKEELQSRFMLLLLQKNPFILNLAYACL